MELLNKTFDSIEKLLLPKGCFFTETQKQVLIADGSFNVIAGPGSGKTTVLTAKFANLLMKRKETEKGVCLITHTNVAVEEVKSSLKKLGIISVDYPNFIGTIHEFFNYFFSIRAFNKLNTKKSIRILDDDDYKDKLEPIFRRKNPGYSPDYNIPNIYKQKARLKVDDKYNVFFKNEGKPSYNKILNECLEELFYNGMVTNKQCLELSYWYISENIELIKKALESRFSCILLDEAQDTNALQYSLLEMLTENTKIKYQKYGDPYQALYSIYENETSDSWVPNDEIKKGIQLKEIDETTRFGTSISNVVKNVCMEDYDHFHSLEGITSFPAHFLTFKSNEDLVAKYNKIIADYEKKNISFRECDKKDAIVSDKHDNLSNYFPSYTKNKIGTVVESSYKSIYNYLINEFSILFERSKSEMKSLLIEDLELAKWMSLLISELNADNISNSKVEEVVQRIVEGIDINVQIFVNKIVEQVISARLNNCEIKQEECKYYLNTIHGVKGETHRSTMLILRSTLDYKINGDNKLYKLVKPFLLGKRNFDGYVSSDHQKLISALKLAYVALSRAKYLIIIAIPNEDIEENDKQELIDNNWVEIEWNYQ